MNKHKKTFVIINSYFIGDTLLVNSLVQNIKRIYPDSNIVMLINESLKDIAKYQKDVDDVIIWDRKGKHKGFFNMLKFVFKFPYKNIYAAFPVYGMDRPIILAKLLGAKYTLAFRCGKGIFNKLLNSKYPINAKMGNVQKELVSLLSGITQEELIDYPMRFYNKNLNSSLVNDIKYQKYVVLSPITSSKEKDIPYETVSAIIKLLHDYKVVLLGSGDKAKSYSDKFKNEKHRNLINYFNKTSLMESADIIANSFACISADTGLMHLACALDKPVTSVFYNLSNMSYIPDDKIYNSKTITENHTPENIVKTFMECIS